MQPAGNKGGLPAAPRIIAYDAVLHHIGYTVLKETEHVRSVIGAKSVTGTKILVYPNPHVLYRARDPPRRI